MNLLAWLLLGGIVGWLASLLVSRGGRQVIVLNIAVGIVGAFLAGWFLAPMVGVGTVNQNNFSAASVIVSLVGALVLLAVFNLLRRGSVS